MSNWCTAATGCVPLVELVLTAAEVGVGVVVVVVQREQVRWDVLHLDARRVDQTLQVLVDRRPDLIQVLGTTGTTGTTQRMRLCHKHSQSYFSHKRHSDPYSIFEDNIFTCSSQNM